MTRMLLAGALLAYSSFAVATAHADTLTISAWGGTSQEAQRKVYFEPFSKETGVSIVEDEFLGGIGILRTQAMSGSPTWNVVQIEDQELQLGCEEGLYVPIDYEMLGIPQDAFIPGAATECGIGAYVWSKVLGYDGSKLEKAPQNWADFWDTTTWPGTRALRRGPQYNLEFALIADGVPVADVYDVLATPEGVDRAFAKLDEIKPNLIWWEAGAQPLQMMAAGEVVMTSVYNGRVTTSNRTEGTNFVGVWPGSAYSIDSWVIIDGTPNIETAHAFLKYASDPERQAQLPEYIAYGPTVVDAVQHVKPDTAPLLPTTPANLEVAFEMDTAFWVEHIESLTERFDRWASQ
jgi:putative spermidine/putrescine transport system substrate-binding protein